MARNKEINQRMKEKNREKILSTALLLFATKGLSATKITDITSTSGMSQGLVYHYYKSKEEIFIELIKNAFEKLNTATRTLENLPISPRDKIKKAIEELLQSLEENEGFAKNCLLIAQATASEAIPEEAKLIIKKENVVPYEVLTRIIIEGQKDGSIKKHNANELALVFWTSINGLAIYKASHGKKFKAPDTRILFSIFF